VLFTIYVKLTTTWPQKYANLMT